MTKEDVHAHLFRKDLEEHVKQERWNRWLWRAGLLLVLASLVAAVIVLLVNGHERDRAIHNLSVALSAQRDQVKFCSKHEELQKTEKCTKPIAPPPTTVIKKEISVPGPVGPVGPEGAKGRPPKPFEVRRAVNAYCADTGKCDGHNPTQAQVFVAVRTYCNARGECRGPQGNQGTQGQQGPPPTPDQVLDAVNAYCSSHSNCQGPQGPQGPPGKDGQDGRSVTDVSAVCHDNDLPTTDDNSLTVTFKFSSGDPESFTFDVPCTPTQ